MLKLKLEYFGHLMGRVNSPEKTLMLGKIEGRRRRRPLKMSNSPEKTLMLGKIEGRRRSRPLKMRWLDSLTGSLDMS